MTITVLRISLVSHGHIDEELTNIKSSYCKELLLVTVLIEANLLHGIGIPQAMMSAIITLMNRL